MIGIPPVKSDINSTFIFAIFINNLTLIIKQVVGMFVSSDKLSLKDYFYVISLDFSGKYDTFFIDSNIGMFKVISSEHFKEKSTTNSPHLSQVSDFSCMLLCMRVNSRFEEDPYPWCELFLHLLELGT